MTTQLFRRTVGGGTRLAIRQAMATPAHQLGHLDSARPARGMAERAAGNAFVNAVYAKLTPFYDLVFGAALQPGRVAAIARMDLAPGARVLEVGVGTGLGALLYPPDCRVVGIDLSSDMLEKGRERIAREGLSHIRLQQMDAASMRFPDESFDVVYAPYTISVVPDPVRVACEMRRVCRPGGKILILNHFLSTNPLAAFVERSLTPLTVHIGFRADLEGPTLLAQAGLRPVSVDHVNVPPIWSLITCIKD